jgi:hypothetical protein
MPDRIVLLVVILGVCAVAAAVAYESWRKRNDPRPRRGDGSSGVEGSWSGRRDRDGDGDGDGGGDGGGD